MSAAPERTSRRQRVAWILARLAVWLPTTAWCTMAIAWMPRGPDAVSWSIAAGFAALATFPAFGPMPALLRGRVARAACTALLWSATIAWFWWVPAPADDHWQPDVAQEASISIDGDVVTVSGVRNFEYRTSDTDADERWEVRSYDLAALRTVDLFFSFWGPELICHNFVSFGFERADGTLEHVAVSIEARKRRGQDYSAVGGMFRQFTLIYVWTDERDVVRVRTNFRGERVHRYRVHSSPENARILFERYAIETMQLDAEPRWYNAVTQSCGVDILRTAWGQRMPLFPAPRMLLNGTWERQAWDEGRIEPALGWEETLRMADVTEDAKAAPLAGFGAAIRRRDPLLRMEPPEKRPPAR